MANEDPENVFYSNLMQSSVSDLLNYRYPIQKYNHLHQAILNGDVSSINLLLEKVPALCTEVDFVYRTPLHYSVKYFHSLPVLRVVVQNSKTVINNADGFLGTAFVYVFWSRKLKIRDWITIAQLFVQNGADFSKCRGSLVRYALRYSKLKNDIAKLPEFMKYIIQHGAYFKGEYCALKDVISKCPAIMNLKTKDNYTLFFEACKYEDLKKLNDYVNYDGVEFNVKCDDGLTPLIALLSDDDKIDMERITWYLHLDTAVNPTIGHNESQQNALTIAMLKDDYELLVSHLFYIARKRKFKFSFSRKEYEPHYIALHKKCPTLLRLVAQYGYIDYSWNEEILINRYIAAEPALQVLSNVKRNRVGAFDHFLTLDSIGFVVFEGVFRWNSLIDSEYKMFDILLDHQPATQLNVTNILTLLTISTDPAVQNLMDIFFRRVSRIFTMNIRNLKVFRGHRFFTPYNIDYVNTMKSLTYMPDHLLVASINCNQNILRYLDSWCVTPFIMKAFFFEYSFLYWDDFCCHLLRFLTIGPCFDKIPIGSRVGTLFYNRIRSMLDEVALEPQTPFGGEAQAAFDELDFTTPTSLKNLAAFQVRLNCGRMQLNTGLTFEECLQQTVPVPYHFEIISNDHKYLTLENDVIVAYPEPPEWQSIEDMNRADLDLNIVRI